MVAWTGEGNQEVEEMVACIDRGEGFEKMVI